MSRVCTVCGLDWCGSWEPSPECEATGYCAYHGTEIDMSGCDVWNDR